MRSRQQNSGTTARAMAADVQALCAASGITRPNPTHHVDRTPAVLRGQAKLASLRAPRGHGRFVVGQHDFPNDRACQPFCRVQASNRSVRRRVHALHQHLSLYHCLLPVIHMLRLQRHCRDTAHNQVSQISPWIMPGRMAPGVMGFAHAVFGFIRMMRGFSGVTRQSTHRSSRRARFLKRSRWELLSTQPVDRGVPDSDAGTDGFAYQVTEIARVLPVRAGC